MKAIHLLASRGTRLHRGLPTDAVLAELYFGDKDLKAVNAGCLHEGSRRHRALPTDAVLAELFFGDFCCRHEPKGPRG